MKNLLGEAIQKNHKANINIQKGRGLPLSSQPFLQHPSPNRKLDHPS